ncbi:MAG: DUF368 domain-containing protein [Gammaproteobacteria bacterium]
MKSFSLVLKGFCMGAADVVPGVSGGTMALILGIYRELIDAIKSFDMAWLKATLRFDIKKSISLPHFAFLVPLMIGIIGAVLFFTRVISIPNLLESSPELIYGLFFGLIIGSIIVLLVELKSSSIAAATSLIAGAIFGFLVVTLVPTETPTAPWFIFLSGMIAICAMVLPGISGSFLLLILGKYAFVLNGIGHFEISIIVPFALGAVLGLMLFTRFLSWLLHRYEQLTMNFIVGILVASLWVIWPFQERVFVLVREKQRLISSTPILPDAWSAAWQPLMLAIIGCAVVLILNTIAKNLGSRKL